MNKKVWINISKGIAFALIICVVCVKILDIFNYKDMGGGGGWQRFYEMPSKTADVVFFGSSHAHCTIDHSLLWDEQGIAGYTMSAGSQKLDSTYYFVKEAIEVQQPKVLVVEVWGAIFDDMDNSDETVFRNTLGMKWSANLLDFVNYMVDNMGENSVYRNRVLTKIPIIHSRYTELTRDDFEDRMPYMRGYRGSFERVEFEKTAEVPVENNMLLSTQCEEYLYKIIELAKKTNTDLVFFVAPYVISEEHQLKLNKVAEIASEENIMMVNYNHLYEEIGLDFSTDFRDTDHVNNYGAAKVTSHLGAFLKDNFELPDRRGQSGYEAWDLNKRYLDGKTVTKALSDAAEVNAYLQVLSSLKDQTVIVSLTGNHTAAGDVYYESLAKLGISYEDYTKGGVWVFENGIPRAYLPGKEYNQCYKVRDNEIHLESKLVGPDELQEEEIIFDGHNYSFVENGINILVYDQVTRQVIDSAGVDIYVGFDVVREEENRL